MKLTPLTVGCLAILFAAVAYGFWEEALARAVSVLPDGLRAKALDRLTRKAWGDGVVKVLTLADGRCRGCGKTESLLDLCERRGKLCLECALAAQEHEP